MFETGTAHSFELQVFSYFCLKRQKKCLHSSPPSRRPRYKYKALARNLAAVFSYFCLKIQKKCLHSSPTSRRPSYYYYFWIPQALARTLPDFTSPVTLHKQCVGPRGRASQGSNVVSLNTKDNFTKQTTFAPYLEANSIPGDKRTTQVCLWWRELQSLPTFELQSLPW